MKDLFDLNKDIFLSSNKIVIYGAGNTGLDCFVELMNRDFRIDYFCDSNPSKIGIHLMNKLVISPQDLYAHQEEYSVIIASQFYEEIEKQLRENGVEDIYCYRKHWRVDW